MISRRGGCATTHQLDANELEGKEIFFSSGIPGFPAYHRFRLERFKTSDGSSSPFFMPVLSIKSCHSP